MVKCKGCKNPHWFVCIPAYDHTPGMLRHFCSLGEVNVSVADLEGEELAWAQKLVEESRSDSKKNAIEHLKEGREEWDTRGTTESK